MKNLPDNNISDNDTSMKCPNRIFFFPIVLLMGMIMGGMVLSGLFSGRRRRGMLNE